jgi:4-diphosphocytidyl-2-C-methyl-D-erythritol kinase
MLTISNAKINIGLNIVSKRDDGFHNLETIFYPVKLSDAIEIAESHDIFTFSNTGLIVDSNSDDNLVVKAYNLLKKDFNLPEIKIHLHKIIPFGAGLGGGSSNAAFTLKILNKNFNLQLPDDVLIDYARKLGSDCAFFIKNKPVFAFGKGDNFENINLDLSDYKIIMVKPDINVSTKEAYSGVKPQIPEISLKTLINSPVTDWKDFIFNDFEKNIFKIHPDLKKIKQKLYNQGAKYASMSGSGSTVYGIFDKSFNKKLNFENCFIWQNDL